jgi:hypothetical protein
MPCPAAPGLLQLIIDPLQDRLLFLIEARLVLFDQVVALRIDRNDQRAELPDLVDPQRLRHAEVLPFRALDLLDLGRGEHRAAAGEDRVHRLVLDAAGGGLGAHAALADDELHAGLPDELLLELFHAHAGGRSDRHHFVFAIFLLAHDGAGVEDRAALQVHRQFAAEFDQAAVRHVAAGDQRAGQVYDVADVQRSEVFIPDGGGEDFFHSETPWCEMTS